MSLNLIPPPIITSNSTRYRITISHHIHNNHRRRNHSIHRSQIRRHTNRRMRTHMRDNQNSARNRRTRRLPKSALLQRINRTNTSNYSIATRPYSPTRINRYYNRSISTKVQIIRPIRKRLISTRTHTFNSRRRFNIRRPILILRLDRRYQRPVNPRNLRPTLHIQRTQPRNGPRRPIMATQSRLPLQPSNSP